MATIAVHEFISLDGVFESPTWTFEFGFDPKMGDTLGEITGSAQTILLGRRTYEMFAPAWRDRTVEDDPGAPFFNQTEKLVVGSQPLAEEWANSTPIGAYDADAIRRLKDERDGVIYVSGSGQLVRACSRTGLSTSCTCSSTPSRWARARSSGPTARARRSSRWWRTTSTTTASSTWATVRLPAERFSARPRTPPAVG